MNVYRLILITLMIFVILPIASAIDEVTTPKSSERTSIYTEEGATGCLRCHSGEKMRAIAISSHGNMDAIEMPVTNSECESCHGPGSIHVSRAHGGRGFPPLTTFGRGSKVSPREDQMGACLSCHESGVAGLDPIPSSGSAHDKKNINCSTCHKVHVETDPISDREHQAKTCFRCHRKQKEEHPRFEDKSIDFDALSCSTCHDVHQPAVPWE